MMTTSFGARLKPLDSLPCNEVTKHPCPSASDERSDDQSQRSLDFLETIQEIGREQGESCDTNWIRGKQSGLAKQLSNSVHPT